LRQSAHVMSQPTLRVFRNLDGLDSVLIRTGPSDDGFGNPNPLLVRKGDGHGEDFSSAHGHISRQLPSPQDKFHTVPVKGPMRYFTKHYTAKQGQGES